MKRFAKILSVGLVFFGMSTAAKAAVENRSLQIEGLVLGTFPRLGDGLHVREKSGRYYLEPAQPCLEGRMTEKAGIAFSGMSFAAESRIALRNKMTGVIGYPGLQSGGDDASRPEWMASAQGLAVDYFKDNLARRPAANVAQIMFMPMVLSPEPMLLSRTKLTPEAQRILDTEGWDPLKRYCGTHLVMAVGEENYVVYNVRAIFNSESPEPQSDYVYFGHRRQTPVLVLDDLYRMRERGEFAEGRGSVTVDVLQVGGTAEDVAALRTALAGLDISFASMDVPNSTVTRATVTCTPRVLERCQKFAQIFLDYQFGRLTFSGVPQNFAPVRFRLVPFDFVKNFIKSG